MAVIRVPLELHRILKARAAEQGLTLEGYVSQQLVNMTAQIKADEIRENVNPTKPIIVTKAQKHKVTNVTKTNPASIFPIEDRPECAHGNPAGTLCFDCPDDTATL